MMKLMDKANRWRVIALTVVLLSATYNAMAEMDCNTTLTGMINDSLRVSAGETCTLTNATVNGAVEVLDGALNSSSSTINGALTISLTDPGESFEICDTTIAGHLGVVGTQASSSIFLGNPADSCGGDIITAGVTIELNQGTVDLVEATVSGSVGVPHNSGTIVIGGNTIGGALHCAGNANISNGGLPNTVSDNGSPRGQCASL